MNLFVVALLAFAAFYFLMSDMLSFAVACVAALVVVLYYYSSGDSRALQARGAPAGARGSAQSEGPLVVRLGRKQKPHPELYRVRVYPTWENRSAWEETSRNIGFELSSLGGTVYRMFTGKHAEKGMDIQPDELFRGR